MPTVDKNLIQIDIYFFKLLHVSHLNVVSSLEPFQIGVIVESGVFL